MAEPVRLQKFLSSAGVASRRGAEDLITDGRVAVNGRVVTELGTKVDPARDRVQVDGRAVRAGAREWFALYKPRGFLSTRSDPQGRRTLYELVPDELHRLFHVGRLDYDSEGLVLLTNDGDTANLMMHPRYGAEREYEVKLDAPVTDNLVAALLHGVQLDDGPARATHVRRHGARGVMVTLTEGRNREVRRMFAALGREVVRLRRVRYATVGLGGLRPGEWRQLDRAEISELKRSLRSSGQA